MRNHERNQTEQGAYAGNAACPGGSIGRIALDELDLGSSASQQFRKLVRLIGHAAGRRRQRANQRNPQPLETCHGLAELATAAEQGAR